MFWEFCALGRAGGGDGCWFGLVTATGFAVRIYFDIW